MLDHLELRTRDLPASVRFYAAVLEPLGYQQSVGARGTGFGDAHGHDFFLVQGEPADHAHFAFRASSRALVRSCCEQGGTLNALERPPALAAHIHPHYYAGYVRDPDGRLVEFTCHESE